MAAGLEKKDILSDDVKKAFVDLEAAIKASVDEVVRMTAEAQKMNKALGGSNIVALTKAQKDYEVHLKNQVKTQQELEKLERLRNQTQQAATNAAIAAQKAQEQQTRATERQAAAAQKAAKQHAQESSEYAKLSKRLNEARSSARDLAAQYGINDARARAAAKGVMVLHNQISRIDASLGVHGRNVGNYSSALKGLGVGLLGGFGITLGISQLVNGLKDAFTKSVEFEKGLSSLSSITGLQGKALKDLGKEARAMARETTVSAVDTLKAMELIGSKRPELLKDADALAMVAEKAIVLNEAAGGDLPVTTESLMSIMNQMRISADGAGNAINVLAAGSKAGPVPISYLATAIEKAGTTAKMMGLAIEQTTGAIEAIGPFFKDAATAGNSFEKVLLKMQAKQIGYKNGVFDLNRAIDELRVRFGKGETAVTIFGEEHQKMANILVQNQQSFNDLTKAVTGTNTAYEQAAINTDNFAGASKRLSNAWDELMLSMGNTEVAKDAVNALARALNNLSFAMKTTEEQGGDIARGALKELDERIGSLTKEEKLKALAIELQVANRGLEESNSIIKAAEGAWVKFKDILQDGTDAFNLFSKSQADAAEEEKTAAEAYKIRIKAIQDRIDALNNQSKADTEAEAAAKEAADAEAVRMAAETVKMRDLITEKEKELKIVREKPAATEAATLARNLEIKTIEDEIKRLRELGSIKKVEELPFNADKLKDEKDDVNNYLKAADEEYFESQIETWEKERDALEEHEKAKADIKMQYAEAISSGLSEIEDSLFSNRADKRDAEMQAELDGFDSRLENEKLDDEQRAEIQKQRDYRERQLKIRNAKAEKQDALMKLGVDTTLTLAKIKAQAAIMGSNPVTAAAAGLALAQIPIVLVSSALSAAAIAARKIPEYEKGVKSHVGGPAILGDGGQTELAILPSGEKFLSPSKSTLYPDLPRGTEVVPGADVAARLQQLTRDEMVELANGRHPQQVHNTTINIDELVKEQRATRKSIEANRLDESAIRRMVSFEVQRSKMRN